MYIIPPEIYGGRVFYFAVNDCKNHLKENGLSEGTLVFNGLEVNVNIESYTPDLCAIYDLKSLIRRIRAGHER